MDKTEQLIRLLIGMKINREFVEIIYQAMDTEEKAAQLLDYLKAIPGKHFTVAELRERFSRDNKPIGTATIYRQLEKFVEEGDW